MIKIAHKIQDGFDEIIFNNSIPDGYTDITSVSNYIKWGEFYFKDYKFIRKRLQEFDFSTLTALEKFIVCQFKGSTEENNKSILGTAFDYWMSEFDLKSQHCRKVRFSVAKTILIKNVSLNDRYAILGFLNTTKLEDNYIKYGIEGTTEGDPIEGLFNYIEATGTYTVSGISAANVTMIGAKTKSEMVVEIMDCLRNGNY